MLQALNRISSSAEQSTDGDALGYSHLADIQAKYIDSYTIDETRVAINQIFQMMAIQVKQRETGAMAVTFLVSKVVAVTAALLKFLMIDLLIVLVIAWILGIPQM